MLGVLKTTFKKSEAAVIVQNLLQLRKHEGAFFDDPASTANDLVRMVYDSTPERFNGKRGVRPHKLSFAARALIYGVQVLNGDDRKRLAYLACIEQLMLEVERNETLYPFNQLDKLLFSEVVEIFSEESIKFNSSPLGQDINSILGQNYPTWDKWYEAFKLGAGEVADTLPALIDFMDHTPLKEGFRDGVDPVPLGRDFAKNFDITKFGISK